MVFGGKKRFEQLKGRHLSGKRRELLKREWCEARQGHLYSRGDASKGGQGSQGTWAGKVSWWALYLTRGTSTGISGLCSETGSVYIARDTPEQLFLTTAIAAPRGAFGPRPTPPGRASGNSTLLGSFLTQNYRPFLSPDGTSGVAPALRPRPPLHPRTGPSGMVRPPATGVGDHGGLRAEERSVNPKQKPTGVREKRGCGGYNPPPLQSRDTWVSEATCDRRELGSPTRSERAHSTVGGRFVVSCACAYPRLQSGS